MAATRLRVSRGLIERAMRSGETLRALRAKRDKLVPRAEALARAEGVDLELKTSEGVRPKGRPYARLTSVNDDQEWGDAYTERRRILGRVAEES